MRKKLIIGRVEKVHFPDLGLYDIDAKVDTGAYTSAIHCHDVEPFLENGIERVAFSLLDPGHPNYNHRRFVFPIHTRKVVRSSFGQEADRFIIRASVLLFGIHFPLELSLADRSLMDYPVLLGRKALRRRFLVDVSKKYLSQ